MCTCIGSGTLANGACLLSAVRVPALCTGDWNDMPTIVVAHVQANTVLRSIGTARSLTGCCSESHIKGGGGGDLVHTPGYKSESRGVKGDHPPPYPLLLLPTVVCCVENVLVLMLLLLYSACKLRAAENSINK
jgi:hypothetical protein